MKARLDQFDPRRGFERGKPVWFELAWYLVKMVFFLSAFPWPSELKARWLRIFGAVVGTGVIIKPRVNIHMPWRLRLGDYVWIGEEVFLLNLAQIDIGAHCCLSQRAFLCTGNHDYRDPAFSYRNAPICLGDGVWIGAQVFVGPGVTIGSETVVAACGRVSGDLPGNTICFGNPAQPLKPRWTNGIQKPSRSSE